VVTVLCLSVCLSVCLAYMKSSKRQKSASSDSDTNSSDSDSSDKQQTVNSEVSIIPTITRESLIVNTETDECFFFCKFVQVKNCYESCYQCFSR